MKISRRYAALTTLIGSSANTFIVSIQAVVLIPLYLHAIGPHLYGAWLASGDILVWLQTFDLGLPNLMIQRIGAAYGRGESRVAIEYFATGMLVMTAIASLIGTSAVAVSPYISSLMGLTGAEAKLLQNCFTVSAITAALNLFSNGIVGFSRGIQDTKFLNSITVVASILGFGVSLFLVLAGAGLWAVAFGHVTRNVTVFVGCIFFAISSLRSGLYRYFCPRREMLHEFSTILPVTALGGIGYALMNQSESAVVAIFLKPELATILTLNRKVIEVGRGLIDIIAFATYGGFAHLIASDQRHRVLHVHAEVTALRLSLAILAASAYMAINHSLINVWIGSSEYGGPLLTILIALQFLVVGGSFLMNYLYRALGPVMQGSIALLAESVVRVPLMIGLVKWLGLPGIPLAGIITGGFFMILAYRWTIREVSQFSDPYPRTSIHVWCARIAVFFVGMLICVFVQWNSWIFVGFAGSSVLAFGGAILLSSDPLLNSVREPLLSFFAKVRALVVR
ncbi:MAG: hypothetical protein JXA33_18895 [Anaerolineae bacterium]|nr:hypothetical protein [Anaerolineae bacterium]